SSSKGAIKTLSAPVATPMPTLQLASSRDGKSLSNLLSTASRSEDSKIQGSEPLTIPLSSLTCSFEPSLVRAHERLDSTELSIFGRRATLVVPDFSFLITVIAG